MLKWNYRIIKHPTHYAIHEVYYDGNGRPHTRTEDAMTPCGESLEGLQEDFELMKMAFNKPALDSETYEDAEGGNRPEELLQKTGMYKENGNLKDRFQ